MKPNISVILPVFRNHILLPEAIHSLLDQNLPENFPWEIVIIDDGSGGEGRVWQKIQDLERRIKSEKSFIKVTTIKRLRNDGPGLARAQGVAASSADWICYLDVDDLMHRDRIANAWENVSKFWPNADIIFSRYTIVDGKTNTGTKIIDPKLYLDKYSSLREASNYELISDSIGFIHNRRIYNAVGGWPPFLLNLEDGIMLRRMLRVSDVKFEFDDKFAGTKRNYISCQGKTCRRFGSGLYIKVNTLDEKGPMGQYLDDADLAPLFMNTAEDPEWDKRSEGIYVSSLTNSKYL